MLTVGAGTGYTVGSPASASGSIVDNDVPSLVVSDHTVTEGNTGTTTISITVTLTAPLTTNVTFTITTVQGTATAAKDYQAKTSTLTIKAGSTSAVFQVVIVNDKVGEPTETFSVTITSATVPILKGTGTVTIVDNDGFTAFAAAPASATASTSGLTTIGASANVGWITVHAAAALRARITLPRYLFLTTRRAKLVGLS